MADAMTAMSWFGDLLRAVIQTQSKDSSGRSSVSTIHDFNDQWRRGRTMSDALGALGTTAEGVPAVLKALLGQKLRATLSDGRVVEGRFECIDNNNNVLLQNVPQLRS